MFDDSPVQLTAENVNILAIWAKLVMDLALSVTRKLRYVYTSVNLYKNSYGIRGTGGEVCGGKGDHTIHTGAGKLMDRISTSAVFIYIICFMYKLILNRYMSTRNS